MPSNFYVLNPVGVIVISVLVSFAGTAAGIYFASSDTRRPRVNYVVWYVGLLLALQALFSGRGAGLSSARSSFCSRPRRFSRCTW